jgi:hypothetical protein
MLLVGTLSGLAVQVTDVSPLAYFGVAAYLVLVVLRLAIKVNGPDRVWYENRLVAESVKSLAWRFAVGGAPFQIGEDDKPYAADEVFSERLSGVIRDASHVPLPDPRQGTEQITAGMRSLRRQPLASRIETYEHDRVYPQLVWYATKAEQHSKRSNRLDMLMLGASGAAVVFGFGQAIGVITVNLLGLAGIVAAIVATWQATTHYSKQANDYSMAAHQLTIVQTMIGHQEDEEEWAGFVDDTEDGISREHTSWRVARAQP